MRPGDYFREFRWHEKVQGQGLNVRNSWVRCGPSQPRLVSGRTRPGKAFALRSRDGDEDFGKE